MKILTNGFYRTKGMYFEDAHGGGINKGYIYIYIKFNKNQTLHRKQELIPDFDIINYITGLKKINAEEEYFKGYRGRYTIQDDSFINFIYTLSLSSGFKKIVEEKIKIISEKEIEYKGDRYYFHEVEEVDF